MKHKRITCLSLDMALYGIYQPEYNPLKNIQTFWDRNSLQQIRDNIIELQSNVNSEQLSKFLLDLLRALAAYLTAHLSNLDLAPLSLSEVFEMSKEELKATKTISDFFQRVSPSNTNS